MDLSKYIKVTAPGGVTPVILLAANRDFFQARGFKIEKPTEDEVKEFFPEERIAAADVAAVPAEGTERTRRKRAKE